MRAEKALKNSLISVFSQFIILILSFINRKMFVIFLDIQFLGYESLFSNIFNLLNVTELGIGGIITYHLYKELANNNKEEISKLMLLYKYIYRIIALVIFGLGIFIYFILPYIISDEIADWNYIHIIYLIQLAGTILNFFLSYNRTIFIADQKEYKTVEIDLFSKLVTQILQIVAIAIFKSFILYLIIKSLCIIIANGIITLKMKKIYSYINGKSTFRKKDLQKWNIIQDMKNFVVHKIAYVIYSGTDNILISIFCGINQVALYGNYYLVQSNVMNILLYKLLNPIQASIGNFIYECKDENKQREKFLTLDLFGNIFASYIMAGFLIFFQPTIAIWMGKEYLLPFTFVIFYCITVYITVTFEIVYKYRSTFGEYNKDRNFMIWAAFLNLFISVFLAKKYGIVGIQIGTICGLLPIVYGRIKVVVADFLKMNINKYLWQHIRYASVDFIMAFVIVVMCNFISLNFIGIVYRILIWGFMPTLFNYIHYKNKKEWKEIVSYMRIFLHTIRKKFFHIANNE